MALPGGHHWRLHSNLTAPIYSRTAAEAEGRARVRTPQEVQSMWDRLTSNMKAAYKPYNQQLYALVGRYGYSSCTVVSSFGRRC